MKSVPESWEKKLFEGSKPRRQISRQVRQRVGRKRKTADLAAGEVESRCKAGRLCCPQSTASSQEGPQDKTVSMWAKVTHTINQHGRVRHDQGVRMPQETRPLLCLGSPLRALRPPTFQRSHATPFDHNATAECAMTRSASHVAAYPPRPGSSRRVFQSRLIPVRWGCDLRDV
jgi:hypothetical protein